ncbi:hypothetical protein MCFN_00120 [Mycoplasmopsis californica]|uniref:tRNA-binding domain-containing protein n=2 Tax=Mycoplasmopsis californica TaxID=2113 RepID=A0A059XQA5_9BACT|nr:hypothetical protein [Mycoplasmopsis californica]AIA29205.1 hypothetical protein MCFN_00120 [Mycoplasmopsis californica]
MAILVKYDIEFNNIFELIYNTSVISDDYEIINLEKSKLIVHYDKNTMNVASVVIEQNSINHLKQWSIASDNFKSKIEENINKNTEKQYIFTDKATINVGKIIERSPHPKSEKLFVLKVDFGNEVKQIITNTTYTSKGKYLAWYNAGSLSPDGNEIKLGEVMGVSSEGMLCSADSLGLTDFKEEFENDVLASIENNQKDMKLGENITNFWPELVGL